MKQPKKHPATIMMSRRAKEIERRLMESFGDAAPYVARSYIYKCVADELGTSERTARKMLNNVPEADL